MAIIIFLLMIPVAIYSGIFVYGLGYRSANFIFGVRRSAEEIERREKDLGYVAMFRRRAV